jgi:uncharacterized protein YndB with AHSA1/START domain
MHVQREVVLPVAPDVAWEAVTDDAELAAWFATEAELDAQPGGAGRFVDDDGLVRRAVVETVEAERRLRFVWWPEDGSRAPTSVDLELTEVAEGTRLVVIEAPVASAAWPAAFARLEARCSALALARV